MSRKTDVYRNTRSLERKRGKQKTIESWKTEIHRNKCSIERKQKTQEDTVAQWRKTKHHCNTSHFSFFCALNSFWTRAKLQAWYK